MIRLVAIKPLEHRADRVRPLLVAEGVVPADGLGHALRKVLVQLVEELGADLLHGGVVVFPLGEGYLHLHVADIVPKEHILVHLLHPGVILGVALGGQVIAGGVAGGLIASVKAAYPAAPGGEQGGDAQHHHHDKLDDLVPGLLCLCVVFW